MRTDAEVKKRLRHYERRWKQFADKNGGAFWWALKYSAEKEWADWFLRRKRRTTRRHDKS